MQTDQYSSALVLAANGISYVDTYTKEQLQRCSIWGLSDGSGPQTTWVALRDRAMLLMSCATAFRGGSCRALEWSDLFMSRVLIDGSNIDAEVPVSASELETPLGAEYCMMDGRCSLP
jgi:hypothetical protein